MNEEFKTFCDSYGIETDNVESFCKILLDYVLYDDHFYEWWDDLVNFDGIEYVEKKYNIKVRSDYVQ